MPGGEIENRHIGRYDDRRSQIGDRGGRFLADITEQQTQRLGRLPGETAAIAGDSAEIGEVFIAGIGVQRQIADRVQHPVAAAGNGQRDIAADAAGPPAKIGGGGDARSHGQAGDILPVIAAIDAEPRFTGGQRKERARCLGGQIGGAHKAVGQIGLNEAQIRADIGGKRIGQASGDQRLQCCAVQRPVRQDMAIHLGIIGVHGPAPVVQAAIQSGAGRSGLGGGPAPERLGIGEQPRDRVASTGNGQAERRQAVQRDTVLQLIGSVQRQGGLFAQIAAVAGVQLPLVALAEEGAELAQIGHPGGQHHIGTDGRLNDTAFGLQQRALVGIFRIQVETEIIADAGEAHFRFLLGPSAGPWLTIFHLADHRREIVHQDEVEHALVRPIAILQRQLFRKDLHTGDGFRRQIAQFAEAGNAAAVQENHRSAAPTTTRRTGLGAQQIDQLGDGRRAIARNLLRTDFFQHGNIGVDLALQPGGAHHDLVAIIGLWIHRFAGIIVGGGIRNGQILRLRGGPGDQRQRRGRGGQQRSGQDGFRIGKGEGHDRKALLFFCDCGHFRFLPRMASI